MSCEICNDFHGIPKRSELHQAWKGNRSWKKLNFSWEALLLAAQTCHTCSVLLTGCRGCFDLHGIQGETNILSCNIDFAYPTRDDWEKMDREAESQPSMEKEIQFRLRDGTKFVVEIFTLEIGRGQEYYSWPGCWEIIPSTQRTTAGTGSEAAFRIAQEWLTQCLGSSHRSCNSPESPRLPTRVVSVGGTDSDKVYLVEPVGEADKYVCLSHCWGHKQIITTTKSSIKKHVRDGIMLKELSNTFQQAVLFTRRLGIRYIWIDSLCIIQDDSADWQIESGKMADIYSNGYITLAATHARDGDAGLYRETPDFEVAGITPEGDSYHLLFRRRIDHHIGCISDPESIRREYPGYATVTEHPLLTRAWVYQERLLSPRILHFGPYEMFFECRTDVQCECGAIGWEGTSDEVPMGLTKLLHTDALTIGFANMEHRPRDPNGPLPAGRLYIARLWRTMVAEYTSLELTKSTDRLPAIGGLAKEMSDRRPNSKYLAGLWSKSLLKDLIWEAQGASTSGSRRSSPPTTPTWSWASVDCPVMFGDEIMAWDPESDLMFEEAYPSRWLSRVEKCEVTPDGASEYGLVSKGRLEVTGRVVEGVLSRKTIQHKGQDIFTYYVTQGGQDYLIKEDYSFDSEGPERLLPGTEVACLRLNLIRQRIKASLKSLVLRLCGNKNNESVQTYYRIGIMTIELETEDVLHTGGLYQDAMQHTVAII
ncbi:hypothetical protein HJFPF1_11823 [Paramyrothecium foliicola]|nr:hypothetical protein HJFPF1_11823 [Paramyrothecium foliicola]